MAYTLRLGYSHPHPGVGYKEPHGETHVRELSVESLGQQLSTIINNLQEGFWGQPLSTITINFFAPVVAITVLLKANTVSNLIEVN